MSVMIRTTPTLQVDLPRRLFVGRFDTTSPARGSDVNEDGSRSLMIQLDDRPPATATQVIIVQSWFEELKRLVGFDMDPLHRQAIVQGVFGTLLLVALIFWPAGTFDYWQGWLFLGIFSASTIGFTVYLAIYDRPLLERRLKGGPQHEREWSQKIIVSLVLLAFLASIVLPALDYRYAWSPVAPWVSILGDAVIVLSFLFIFRVTQVNSFAASNIRVEKDQKVIDTGAYAHVRHPMYAGAIWLFVRNAACARFVVVARPHRGLRARAFVAASRRGENPAERFARVWGIHAQSALSSGSVRVVKTTRCDPVRRVK